MQALRMRGEENEIGSLVQLLTEARQQRARFYEERLGISAAKAYALAIQPATPEDIVRVTSTPVEQIDWTDLDRVMEASPEDGLALWHKIKQAAREELQSGHRAAGVVDGDGNPWKRARFCVVRESFIEGWIPRNGIESALLDSLAQAYTLREYWIEQINRLTTSCGKEVQASIQEKGHWQPPRACVKESIDQAEAMVDRFDRLFQRNLRSLRDLRRYAPNVMIQNAGQVNIGAQQVNTAQTK